MVVAGLAFWVKLLRLLLGEHVTARRVELPHAPLTSHARYHATFGVVPRFDAPRILLEFDRTWWTAPLRATRLGVESYLREHATTLLRGLATRDDDPLDGIREYMADELRHGRTPSLATIAKRMGSSSRSLQRSLQAAGHTHAELLDDTRRRLALEYLGDARLTLGEVAVVVGYSEPATFYRAFKRWTGVTPGAWRAQRASAQ
jgi:AraC-like DNA-binding protein